MPLGAGHRGVGILDQCFGACAISGAYRNPDIGAHGEPEPCHDGDREAVPIPDRDV